MKQQRVIARSAVRDEAIPKYQGDCFAALAMTYDEGGQALVEFALIITALVLVLMGVFDLGRGVYAYNVTASAAREGARYGIVNQCDTEGIQTRARQNTTALEPSLLSITSLVPPGCNPTESITVIVSYTFQPVTLFFSTFTVTGRSTMTIE